MPGRKEDSVWMYFEKILIPGKTGCRAKCKSCGKDLMGLVARMKQHHHLCSQSTEDSADISVTALSNPPARKRAASPDLSHQPSPAKRQRQVSNYILQTSANVKEQLDIQVARFLYGTNSAFSVVEHPEFVKLMQMLRPGYNPPNRKQVAGPLLDDVQTKLMEECKEKLQDQTVSMALDGWSNIHNEPVVCVSLTTAEGHTYLTETVDTSGKQHTSEYLEGVATSAIKSAEERFSCRVGSFVTDNAANMAKMRKSLDVDCDNIISYGCSAHYMNLLAKDVEIPGVKEHVVQVMKFFRNTHLPAAWYKAAGGKKLVLPQEVRWNSLADCLQSYLNNWSVLLKVCEEHRETIIPTISDKVKNFGIKRNAEDYLTRMKPIAEALDMVQGDGCMISDAVDIWNKLHSDLAKTQPSSVMKKVNSRMEQALTPAHYLANIINPVAHGEKLSEKEVDSALEYCSENYPDCMSTIINYRARCGPFKPYMFSSGLDVSPISWWEAQSNRLDSCMRKLFHQLLGAVASSAGVERVFSTFGLVHSKLRNRLGVAKAGKLVFIYKLLNSADTHSAE